MYLKQGRIHSGFGVSGDPNLCISHLGWWGPDSHARSHVLLQALTRWYYAAALCAAAEHRAACEVRLQGLQQAVAAFAQKLQGLDVLRQGGRGAAPAARSMVDKMTAIIAVWEASRLTHAFSIWSRCLS